jgi:hypothetical protein
LKDNFIHKTFFVARKKNINGAAITIHLWNYLSLVDVMANITMCPWLRIGASRARACTVTSLILASSVAIQLRVHDGAVM